MKARLSRVVAISIMGLGILIVAVPLGRLWATQAEPIVAPPPDLTALRAMVQRDMSGWLRQSEMLSMSATPGPHVMIQADVLTHYTLGEPLRIATLSGEKLRQPAALKGRINDLLLPNVEYDFLVYRDGYPATMIKTAYLEGAWQIAAIGDDESPTIVERLQQRQRAAGSNSVVTILTLPPFATFAEILRDGQPEYIVLSDPAKIFADLTTDMDTAYPATIIIPRLHTYYATFATQQDLRVPTMFAQATAYAREVQPSPIPAAPTRSPSRQRKPYPQP